MISYINACEIAYNHFYETEGDKGLSKALDASEAWIFYAGNSNKLNRIGLIIYKSDGKAEDFILPSPKNLKLLNQAVPVEISESYRH